MPLLDYVKQLAQMQQNKVKGKKLDKQGYSSELKKSAEEKSKNPSYYTGEPQIQEKPYSKTGSPMARIKGAGENGEDKVITQEEKIYEQAPKNGKRRALSTAMETVKDHKTGKMVKLEDEELDKWYQEEEKLKGKGNTNSSTSMGKTKGKIIIKKKN